jgi:hypothetical protein
MEPMEVCEGEFVVKSADFVKVFVTSSNCSTYSAEKSFARGVTVADLKVSWADQFNRSTVLITILVISVQIGAHDGRRCSFDAADRVG